MSFRQPQPESLRFVAACGRPVVGGLLALFATLAIAQSAAPLKNWFDDPFFQVSNALPGCPQPAGPFASEAEMRVASHRRAELGTTCWLTGACDRPNSYAYTRDIAAALEAAFRQSDATARSTVWITVQGRTVFIEGCVADLATTGALETVARSVPYVQQAIAIVYTGPPERPPYKLLMSP